jgi:ribosomal-protein-alanine N-acetyltransferase
MTDEPLLAKNTTVSQAGPEHAALFATLHAACFPEAWDANAFRTFLSQPGTIGLLGQVVKGDGMGQSAGFLLGRCAAGEAEILTIGVLPKHRRDGRGGELLDSLVHFLPADVGALFLEVAAGNEAAIALYRTRGFRRVARRVRYYSDGQDALVLRRDLSPES